VAIFAVYPPVRLSQILNETRGINRPRKIYKVLRVYMEELRGWDEDYINSLFSEIEEALR